MAIKCPECQTENTSDSQFCKKCATPLPPSEGVSVTKTLETPVKKLTKGTIFANRYEVLEELGKGGMGEVYRVKDKTLDEEMALKVLKPEIAADKGIIERFKNELKFARKIAHRNVCKMYDLSEEEETPYITMEYVKGEDLKSFIRRKEKLKEEEVIAVAKQVCEGLAEAHELGVVHRDLKPSNIMIDQKSNAKVMDFGIARSVEAPGVTHTGVMIGTPDYMSPEQAEGEEADQRSDIYSLGVILYEMVTGSVPFKGDTAFSVALKHKTKLPSDPRKLNPEVSENLSRLILICMEKDRERRYQTAEALLNDLQNIEEGLPLGAKIRPRRETFVQTLIRKKLFIPAMVVALAIIAVVIWRVLPQKETAPVPSGKPSLAILYFENFSGDERLDNWRFALPELLITDLIQSKYIRVLRLDEVNSVLQKLNLTEEKTYSLDGLKEIAEESLASHLLKGSFIKAGETFRITATLISGKTAETIGSLNVEAVGNEGILAKIDHLTKDIKNSLGLTEVQIADDIDVEIGKITTSDPEALKYYMEGERYHHQFDFKQAIASLEKAVEIDPEFAMAYRALAVCYRNLRNSLKIRENNQKAFEFKDRLPARERYIVEGSYYSQTEKTYGKAIEIYKRLLEIYPDDFYGNHSLAWLYGSIGELDLAIDLYSRLIQNETKQGLIYSQTSLYYSFKGDYERAKKVWEQFRLNTSNKQGGLAPLGRIYALERKYDLAMEQLDKALALNPKDFWNSAYRGSVYLYQDNFEEALRIYQDVLESAASPEVRMDNHLLIVNLYIGQGRFKKVFAYCEDLLIKFKNHEKQLRRIHQTLGRLYMKTGEPELALDEFKKSFRLIESGPAGFLPYRSLRENLFNQAVAQIEMENLDKAEETLEEIRKLTPDVLRAIIKTQSYYTYVNEFYLKGRMALDRKNYQEAVINLEKAVSALRGENYFYPTVHALYMDSLASAYLQNGDIDKAIKTYEKIHLLTNGRLEWGDIYAKSFYMLGKIYEQQGNKAKAIKHYEKFLTLWKEADPGIAEVEDAKKRLAGLKSQ